MDPAVMKSSLQSGPDCPSLEVLARGMESAAGSPERQAAESHLESCGACRTEMVLLYEFERGEANPEEKDDVEWIAARLKTTPISTLQNQAENNKILEIWPKWWHKLLQSSSRMGVLAAAAAILLFAVAINVPWHQAAPPSEGSTDALRSAPLRALTPAGDLTAAPKEFRWTAVEGATNYVLTVSEVDRAIVFQSKVAATSLPFPVEISRLLQPGKTLVWSVRAEDGSGRELTTSGEQRFRLEVHN